MELPEWRGRTLCVVGEVTQSDWDGSVVGQDWYRPW